MEHTHWAATVLSIYSSVHKKNVAGQQHNKVQPDFTALSPTFTPQSTLGKQNGRKDCCPRVFEK